MSIKPSAKTTEILVQELDKELLVYDLQTNKAFCLNETSAFVWQMGDGTKTVAEISDSISQKFKSLVSEDFVRLALNELKRDGLLENVDELNMYFSTFSRREVIKKVGLASMIALPFITSVTAPSAVNAQSCLPSRTACTSNNNTQGDCCPNLRCRTTREFPAQTTCANCQPSGVPIVSCGSIGGCGNCNSANNNICCDTSAPITNDGTSCLCG